VRLWMNFNGLMNGILTEWMDLDRYDVEMWLMFEWRESTRLPALNSSTLARNKLFELWMVADRSCCGLVFPLGKLMTDRLMR
jgi:hypothetical protein